MSSKGPRTAGVISGALRDAIHQHGPITLDNEPSATKRVVAQLRAAAESGAKLLMPEGDAEDVQQAAIDSLHKRLEKLRYGHARLVDDHRRLREENERLRALIGERHEQQAHPAPPAPPAGQADEAAEDPVPARAGTTGPLSLCGATPRLT
jgi:hypothetical protein